MAGKKRSPKTLAAWSAALERNNDNVTHAAQDLGISPKTLSSAVLAIKEWREKKPEGSGLELPEFPDDDDDTEQIIDAMCRRFTKRKAAVDAHTWFPVNVTDDKPIGLMAVGDPHLDDNGANWPLLREHVEICRNTPGIHAINIGDSTNCWGGRLIKKYADQDTSVATARKLVEWFLLESGMPWFLWLYGNHEHMGDGAGLLAQMAKRYNTARLVMHDWEARFVLRFPNGVEKRVNAAHDFPGHSMWNPNHGLVKAARFGPMVDLFMCGHKHNWAISQWELADQGTIPLMIRTRGYKYIDDYARKLGIAEQEEGASILVVIDPNASTPSGQMMAFADIAAGADYLTWLREKS